MSEPGTESEPGNVASHHLDEEVMDRFGQRLQVHPRLVGFDPAIIIAIITAVIQLLTNCRQRNMAVTPEYVQECCKRQPFLARVYVHTALRDEGIRPLSAEGRAATEAVLDVGKVASATEVQDFLNCCS